ncbi:hypothetical protein ALP92_103791 [Pseudomonas syringae pv. primulae]|uniref:DUF1534 domain-containing protein n=1 Tax=Pseudomonas syringae pv. primulae TaxID=251707 RepID=A0A3M4S7T0_9PSED|nr:hypothetical protein ALP92_103791 [Pseudomonas syringae pv. primulae]
MSRKQTPLTSQNRSVMLRATDLRRILRIGRRASRTACDAERRTIVVSLPQRTATSCPARNHCP